MLLSVSRRCYSKATSTVHRTNLKTAFSLCKHIKCFPSTLSWRNLKTQQSRVILDLSLRKTRAEKSRDFRDVIVVENLCFQNVSRANENEKRAFSNSFCLKKVSEKLRFRDGLVWTVGLTVQIKMLFQIPLVYCGWGLNHIRFSYNYPSLDCGSHLHVFLDQ